MIPSPYAGGIWLPPVQTLVATFIFAYGKNANESCLRNQKRTVIVIRSYGSFILPFTPKTGLIEHFLRKCPTWSNFPVGHSAFLWQFSATNRWICGVIVRFMRNNMINTQNCLLCYEFRQWLENLTSL